MSHTKDVKLAKAILSIEAIEEAYRVTQLGAVRHAWTQEINSPRPCACPAAVVAIARGLTHERVRALELGDGEDEYGHGDPADAVSDQLGLSDELVTAFASGVDGDIPPDFDKDRLAMYHHGNEVREALERGGFLKPDAAQPYEDA